MLPSLANSDTHTGAMLKERNDLIYLRTQNMARGDVKQKKPYTHIAVSLFEPQHCEAFSVFSCNREKRPVESQVSKSGWCGGATVVHSPAGHCEL